MAGYIAGEHMEFQAMASASQSRAVATHRRRLAEQGLSRFEVRGLDADKGLLRELARRLSAGDDAAAALRVEVGRHVGGGAGEPPATSGILAALRRSPLVGAGLDFTRAMVEGRDAEL